MSAHVETEADADKEDKKSVSVFDSNKRFNT